MNERRLKKIKDFLNVEDEKELHIDIIELFKEYSINAKSLYIADLIGDIGAFAAYTVNKANSEITHAKNAISDMINIENVRKTGGHNFVELMIAPMMELFPDAKIYSHSKIEIDFFNEFKENLKKHKEKYLDSYWSTNIVKCNVYLKKLLME